MQPHSCACSPPAEALRLLQVWASLTMVTDVQHRRMLFRFVHLGGERLAWDPVTFKSIWKSAVHEPAQVR